MNPKIPFAPCFKCGKLTNETQSIFGTGHYKCFSNAPEKADKPVSQQPLGKPYE
jgi:hypothetical protein